MFNICAQEGYNMSVRANYFLLCGAKHPTNNGGIYATKTVQ